MGAALSFFGGYSKEGDEFLTHIVTGDEIWLSMLHQRVNVSLWNGITSFTIKIKTKTYLGLNSKVYSYSFLGQKRSTSVHPVEPQLLTRIAKL